MKRLTDIYCASLSASNLTLVRATIITFSEKYQLSLPDILYFFKYVYSEVRDTFTDLTTIMLLAENNSLKQR